MRVDALHRPLLILTFLLPGALLLAGCSGDDDIVDPPSGLDVDMDLIVEDGRLPVWLNENQFVFSYPDEFTEDGIYLSTLDGEITELYPGVHNHDYVPSLGGTHIAFSTPDLDGGVIVASLTGDTTMLLAGARQPAWLDDDTVVMENGDKQFGSVDLAAPGAFAAFSEGSFPRPQGDRIAYLKRESSTPGSPLNLRYYHLTTNASFLLTDDIGVDFIWHPQDPQIYASKLVQGTLSDVVVISLGQPHSVETVLDGATRPSITGDGEHLFADRLVSGVRSGVHYDHLPTSRRDYITGVSRPSAAPSGRRFLAERSDGVVLVTFD